MCAALQVPEYVRLCLHDVAEVSIHERSHGQCVHVPVK